MDGIRFYAVVNWKTSPDGFPQVHGVYLEQKSVEEARAGSLEAQQDILLMVANASSGGKQQHALRLLDWEYLTITELPAPRA